jgi:hypothetical protein
MLLNNNNRLILVHVQTYVLSFHRKWPHSNTLEQNDNQLQRQYTYIVGKYKMYLYEFQKQKEKISLVGFSFLLRGEFKLYVSFYFYFYVILTASNKLNIMSEDVRDNWKRLKLPVFLLYGNSYKYILYLPTMYVYCLCSWPCCFCVFIYIHDRNGGRNNYVT